MFSSYNFDQSENDPQNYYYYSEGFTKEGVGAGGSMITSMLKTGNDSPKLLEMVEKEYDRLFTSL